MRSAQRQRLIGGVLGIAAAAAVMAALSLCLQAAINSRGSNEVDLTAQRTIGLAERRIQSALETLEQLARRDVGSCRGTAVENLRRFAFQNPWVKNLAVVTADGHVLCGSFGGGLGEHQVLSSYRLKDEPGLSLQLLRIGTTERMVALVRHAGSVRLAALIPTVLFSAQVSQDGAGLDINIRMTMPDGTLIVQRGADIAGIRSGERFVASRQSERFGLRTTVVLPDATVQAENAGFKQTGMLVGAAVCLILSALVSILWRRRRDPISDFERAIANHEFVPYYQPVVDLRTGRLRGAEVLIRRRRPDGSIVGPAAFIPLAESTGLIVPLTRALMRRVCTEIGAAMAVRPDIKIGFNLAAAHFLDDTIVTDVHDIFGASAMALRQVLLEVTERQPLENLAGARRVIAGLQELGCSVAIDDVGTGHGGLSYMLKLGADTIKIDKIFIDAMGTERHSTIILETLVDLARSLRMDVVAEGVETFEQVVRLRELGILAAQGYVFSPPLPGSSFLKLVEAIAPLPGAASDALENEPLPLGGTVIAA